MSMKIKGGLLSGLLCLLAVLISCRADGSASYLGVLQGAFSAEVSGTLNGVEFSAQLEARMGASGREIVATFYAPQTICGTVVCKRADGSGYLQAGEVLVEGVEGMAPLLDLFWQERAVSDVALNESGHTVVQAEGLTLTLLPDGTPYRLESPAADLTVISWGMR